MKENNPDKVSVASNPEPNPGRHRARSRAKANNPEKVGSWEKVSSPETTRADNKEKASNPVKDNSPARVGRVGTVRRLAIRRVGGMSGRARVCGNSRRVRNSAAGFAAARAEAAGMIAAVDWKRRKGL